MHLGSMLAAFRLQRFLCSVSVTTVSQKLGAEVNTRKRQQNEGAITAQPTSIPRFHQGSSVHIQTVTMGAGRSPTLNSPRTNVLFRGKLVVGAVSRQPSAPTDAKLDAMFGRITRGLSRCCCRVGETMGRGAPW